MQQTVFNPQKGRLETINIDFTKENTTWFDDHPDNMEVYMVTDFEGGLIIKGRDYSYPVYVYDVSRADVNDDIEKAMEIKNESLDI